MSIWAPRVIQAARLQVQARRAFESGKEMTRKEKRAASLNLTHAEEKLASTVDAYENEIDSPGEIHEL